MPTLSSAAETFLQVQRSPQTNRNYRYIINDLLSVLGPKRKVKRVTYEDLADYVETLVDGDDTRKPLKLSSVSTYVQVIKSFFEFCTRREYTHRSPAADLTVRVVHSEPRRNRAATPEDLRKMVNFARFDKRNYAILIFFIATGCRAEGISSLRIENLDIPGRRAWVCEKGGEWKTVFFADQTVQALEAWLAVRPETDHDFVFTVSGNRGASPLTKSGFKYVIESLCTHSGASRVYGTHALRHSRGQSLAKRGVPVSVTQQILNHAKPDTTIGNYYPSDDEYIAAKMREYELAALEEPENTIRIIQLGKQRSG